MAGLMGKLKEHVRKNRKGGAAKTMPYRPGRKGSETAKAKPMPYKPSTRPARPDDEDGPLKKLRFGGAGGRNSGEY